MFSEDIEGGVRGSKIIGSDNGGANGGVLFLIHGEASRGASDSPETLKVDSKLVFRALS